MGVWAEVARIAHRTRPYYTVRAIAEVYVLARGTSDGLIIPGSRAQAPTAPSVGNATRLGIWPAQPDLNRAEARRRRSGKCARSRGMQTRIQHRNRPAHAFPLRLSRSTLAPPVPRGPRALAGGASQRLQGHGECGYATTCGRTRTTASFKAYGLRRAIMNTASPPA